MLASAPPPFGGSNFLVVRHNVCELMKLDGHSIFIAWTKLVIATIKQILKSRGAMTLEDQWTVARNERSLCLARFWR